MQMPNTAIIIKQQPRSIAQLSVPPCLLTMLPLLKAGIEMRTALGLAFAADTASITIMEIVDNAIMLMIPGAMDANLDEPLFWGSLALALAIAALAAFPVVRWLISRGRGHAVVHAYHGQGHSGH